MISIIIPAYNIEKYIAKALQSLLNQTCKDFEIILVDDGSTDKTADVAKSILGDTNLKYSLITQRNAGVSVARNHGLELATGSYVLFLDGDDYLAPDCLSLMSREFEISKADIVFCGHDSVSENGTVVRPYESRYTYLFKPVSGQEALMEIMKERILPWTGSVMYRKAFLDGLGLRFTKGRTLAQDIEFMWKAFFFASKVSSVPQCLSYYVQRAGSTTGTALMKRFQGLDVLFDLLELFSSKDPDSPVIQYLRRYRLPVDITGLFGALAGKGIPITQLLSIMRKEPRYRQALAEFQPDPDANLAFRRKTQVQMFRHWPWLYLRICHIRERLILAKSG